MRSSGVADAPILDRRVVKRNPRAEHLIRGERPIRHILVSWHYASHKSRFCEYLAAIEAQPRSQETLHRTYQRRVFRCVEERVVVKVKPESIANARRICIWLKYDIVLGKIGTFP
jgi:hypothetical protein